MSHAIEWPLMAVSVLVALAGIGIARAPVEATRPGGRRRLRGARPAACTDCSRTSTSSTRSTTDLIVRPLAAIARACWKVVDILIIDGALHVGAFVTELTGDLGRFTTTGNVRNYALYFFAGVLVLFWWMIF